MRLLCDTTDGYRSMRLLRERNEPAIRNVVTMLHKHEASSPYLAFMPSLVGTPAERDALAEYLDQLVHGREKVSLASPSEEFALGLRC